MCTVTTGPSACVFFLLIRIFDADLCTDSTGTIARTCVTDKLDSYLILFKVYNLLYFMMSSVSPKNYIGESGLRVGHLKVCHLFNKVPDVSTFRCNQCPFIHLLGLS